jgi:predicted transcriptional regulator
MTNLVELTAQIVAAHAETIPLSIDEIIAELGRVHATPKRLDSGQPDVLAEEAKPAITLKEAFRKNEVVCMICGKGGFKTLARHLATAHDITPPEYRQQFGIPTSQSLSARAYTETRKAMAVSQRRPGRQPGKSPGNPHGEHRGAQARGGSSGRRGASSGTSGSGGRADP